MTLIYSIEQLNQVAKQILEQNPPKILLFNGEMGAGKTTLIKKLCETLGVNGATSSPTFSLVNEYQTTDKQKIYHFDCYRLKSEIEALDMGIDEYLHSGHWCFIEWAEKIASLLPEEHAVLTIEILEDGHRKIELQ
jgi:tRNA threonylcarbamoyladenosine biosynthesis protein TsaE